MRIDPSWRDTRPCSKHSPVKCPKPASLHRGNKTTLACHASLRLGAGGFCQLPVPVKPFRTDDDVFPLLPDILCAYRDPAARSAESGWSIAERRAGEFISSGQCEHLRDPSAIRTADGQCPDHG